MDKNNTVGTHYLVNTLLTQPLINSLSKDGYTVAGPVTKKTHKDIMERIIEFRTAQYTDRLDYLLSEEQRNVEIELGIENRSYYFYVEKDGFIAACLRLTPYPFEFSALHPSLYLPALDHCKYIELGRLVADTHKEHKEITLGLIIYACDWAMRHRYQGLIALCSSAAQVMYSRYGLSNITPGGFCKLEIRNNKKYGLMAGSWNMLFSHTLKTFRQSRKNFQSINQMDSS